MSSKPSVLGAQEVLEGLKALRERQPVGFSAFFSSQLGGVVTDPALMVLPFEYRRYRRPLLTRGHSSMMDTSSG